MKLLGNNGLPKKFYSKTSPSHTLGYAVIISVLLYNSNIKLFNDSLLFPLKEVILFSHSTQRLRTSWGYPVYEPGLGELEIFKCWDSSGPDMSSLPENKNSPQSNKSQHFH